jgi:hypothetical protein
MVGGGNIYGTSGALEPYTVCIILLQVKLLHSGSISGVGWEFFSHHRVQNDLIKVSPVLN